LELSRISPSDKLEKKNSLYQWPHKGNLFRSGTSVPLLKVLYVCPVLRRELVLCLFHSEGTADSLFLLFGFFLSFSVFKSIICGSFSADTLTSSNKDLLLSEVSEEESSLN
jgi:hypothetical protein